MTTNNFNEAVKKAMEVLNVKQAELARKTGYSDQHISDLLAGERRWNEDSIAKVCIALGIEITYETQVSSNEDD